MKLSCYIVDDEGHAIKKLEGFIEKTPGLIIAGSALDPLIALGEIPELLPDILFLDVDMPNLTGMQFAPLVSPKTTIVFTTAFRDFAVEAFETAAADYLLKPFGYDRFLSCIQKVRQLIAEKRSFTAEMHFFVKSGIKGKMIRVPVTEIYYIAGALNYIEIYFKEHKVITYLSMAEVLAKLPVENFSRIHKSFIINDEKIESIEYSQVRLTNKSVLPIGRSYRADFQKHVI